MSCFEIVDSNCIFWLGNGSTKCISIDRSNRYAIKSCYYICYNNATASNGWDHINLSGGHNKLMTYHALCPLLLPSPLTHTLRYTELTVYASLFVKGNGGNCLSVAWLFCLRGFVCINRQCLFVYT